MSRLDLTGEVYGRLTVVREVEKIGTHRMWLCLCTCNNVLVTRQARLRSGETRSCGCLARDRFGDLRKTKVGPISYHAMHAHLRWSFGSATEHPCIDCDDTERPHEWSYVRGCPDELLGGQNDGRPNPVPYCLHVEHYQPRCKGCHKAMDKSPEASVRRLRAILLAGSVA